MTYQEKLQEAETLLRHVWNHMHGQNMDGSQRKFQDNDACAVNWNKLSDAIGHYLEPTE